MEYLTKYPKTISLVDGIKDSIKVDSKSGVEHLYVVVKHNGKFPSLKKSSLWNCFNKDRSQLEENLPSSPIVVSEKRIVLSGKLHFT